MRRLALIILAAGLFPGPGTAAEPPDPGPGRFEDAIAAFMAWDGKNAVPDEPILFVGSSSIRLWRTALAFPGKPVINRGFGGSELADVLHYYDRIIRPYAPSQIILYAGDNDIAGGKTAEQVFDDYRRLVDRVQTDLPGTELVFISIKPSKLRWQQWPTMVEANRLVREFAAGRANLGFADLASPLLDASGQPQDVYLDDGLHLNERGYEIWRQALLPFLDDAGGS